MEIVEHQGGRGCSLLLRLLFLQLSVPCSHACLLLESVRKGAQTQWATPLRHIHRHLIEDEKLSVLKKVVFFDFKIAEDTFLKKWSLCAPPRPPPPPAFTVWPAGSKPDTIRLFPDSDAHRQPPAPSQTPPSRAVKFKI